MFPGGTLSVSSCAYEVGSPKQTKTLMKINYTPPKTIMTIKHPPFEDVFPIEHGDVLKRTHGMKSLVELL